MSGHVLHVSNYLLSIHQRSGVHHERWRVTLKPIFPLTVWNSKIRSFFFFNVRDRSRRFTPTLHMLRNDDSRKDEGRSCPGTYVMACVSFAPDKRFRMDDTHRNFPRSDTKTTFWSTLAARRVAAVLGKTRQPSVESQWGNYASSPPVGAADCPQQQWW